VQVYRGITRNPIGIQIGHTGRKASAQLPWLGGKALASGESPWPTIGPSAIAFGEGWHVPRELSREEIRGLVDAFVAATLRAKRIGFDVVELHSAHGYLLHQFLSPLSNRRIDEYGKDRMKFPLEVARAVREVWPKERALGIRGIVLLVCVDRVRVRGRREDDYILEQDADTVGHALISSVHTLKLSSIEGPKLVVSATSAASLPLAIRMRPMRGILLRGSKVYHPSPR
jgi:hypothetical protein